VQVALGERQILGAAPTLLGGPAQALRLLEDRPLLDQQQVLEGGDPRR